MVLRCMDLELRKNISVYLHGFRTYHTQSYYSSPKDALTSWNHNRVFQRPFHNFTRPAVSAWGEQDGSVRSMGINPIFDIIWVFFVTCDVVYNIVIVVFVRNIKGKKCKRQNHTSKRFPSPSENKCCFLSDENGPIQSTCHQVAGWFPWEMMPCLEFSVDVYS